MKKIVFFDKLVKILEFDFGIKFKYNYKENEYFIYDEIKKQIYFYDFTIPKLNLVIEYNGSHVHPNKSLLTLNEFKNWKNAYSKEDANTVLKKDKRKNKLAEKKKFKVLIIWDTDNVDKKLKEFSYLIKECYDNKERKN